MSLWTCLECTAQYAVGLLKCPQCQGTRYGDDLDGAPKSVRMWVGEPGPELVDPSSGGTFIPFDDGGGTSISVDDGGGD